MTASREQQTRPSVDVRVRNVGGIDEAHVDFGPGATVLSGRNATNRSSFLRSIMAAMGSSQPALKADADEGSVELSIGEETYTRTFQRRSNGVSTGGNPYLDDPTLAELFAFLLEDNEARRAVERGDDLRKLMLRPIDTDEIESEINRLQAERDEIDRQLEEFDDLQRRLPDLEEERSRVEREIEETREELADLEDEIDETDAEIEETREEKAELEEKLDELRSERSSLEDVRYDLETERESVEGLRDERAEIEAELDDLEDVSEDRAEVLEERVDSLRGERSELESEISELGTVIGFNEDMLESQTELFEAGEGEVTDRLVGDESTVSCWTCGTEVAVDEIQTTLDHLRDRRQEKVEERSAVSDELEELRGERESIDARRRERRQLLRRLDSVDVEIERREERIEELQADRERYADRVEELEAEVEDLERDDYDDLLELHREANELEFELERLEDERERLTQNTEEIESQLDRREELQERRESISDELTDLRTKVDRIEREAVEAFNEHMAEILDILDYENIERVWIEHREETVTEGRRTVDRTVFDHHVVRKGDDGATYEDTVDHLSESEREVIGLVFALAGYLVHDVHEEVPFVLLDSLEAIDSERIAAIVEYFESYAEYLVVALLPEDAAALDDDYEYVESI